MSTPILHHIVEIPSSLLSTVHTLLPSANASELLNLGAIYHNKRRANTDLVLAIGDYLRIHHQPRRFPAALTDWRKRVVLDDTNWLVIDKPAGVPTHATLDNALENALHQLEVLRQEKLFVTHRLDHGTSGLVVFAKNLLAQKNFNQALAQGLIEKKYHAVVAGNKTAPALGQWLHYMKPDPRCPKQISTVALPNWLECRLQVLSAQAQTAGEIAAWQLEILLQTGRTHQIRAQLAQSGYVILGDQLYGSPWTRDGLQTQHHLFQQNREPLALRCVQIRFANCFSLKLVD